MKKLIIAFISIISLTIPLTVRAQVTAVVKVTGEVTTPLNLSVVDLHQFAQTVVVHKDKDGKDHTYSGVILAEILQKAGVSMNKESLTKYLLVDASDGYKVIFALAELDKNFTDRIIILADTVDGKPLAKGEGPFKIIVQDEKKAARCVRQVTSLKVLSAK